MSEMEAPTVEQVAEIIRRRFAALVRVEPTDPAVALEMVDDLGEQGVTYHRVLSWEHDCHLQEVAFTAFAVAWAMWECIRRLPVWDTPRVWRVQSTWPDITPGPEPRTLRLQLRVVRTPTGVPVPVDPDGDTDGDLMRLLQPHPEEAGHVGE